MAHILYFPFLVFHDFPWLKPEPSIEIPAASAASQYPLLHFISSTSNTVQGES